MVRIILRRPGGQRRCDIWLQRRTKKRRGDFAAAFPIVPARS
jgi:hypothetical protein